MVGESPGRGSAKPADPTTSHELKEDFLSFLRSEVPMPIAAVQTLLSFIARSKSVTVMGLEAEMKEATEMLRTHERAMLGGRKSISLWSACEQFFRNATRTTDDDPEFESVKQAFVSRGERFVAAALRSVAKISEHGRHFVQDGMVVLTHGQSRVVLAILQRAAQTKNFSVVVTEGRPDGSGYRAAQQLADVGIPVTVILDSAVGYIMERVSVVILGAEGVVESGGIVNKVGSFGIAMAAKTFNKPVYVAAESYKFARFYPLTQADLPERRSEQLPLHPCVKDKDPAWQRPALVEMENPSCDYTPSQYISLIFTDLGILTPAAVSDELIRLYGES